jgi:hypothetical protein
MSIDAEPGLILEHRRRMTAVTGLGKAFVLLAVICGLLGILWIAEVFQTAVREDRAANELTTTLRFLLGPVAVTTLGFWLLFRIGRGLLRFSPWSRRAALAVLMTACVPPLVVFLGAAQDGPSVQSALMLVLLAPLALGSFLLASSETSLLFTSEYHEAACSLANPPRKGRLAGLAIKVLVVAISLGSTIVLASLSSR